MMFIAASGSKLTAGALARHGRAAAGRVSTLSLNALSNSRARRPAGRRSLSTTARFQRSQQQISVQQSEGKPRALSTQDLHEEVCQLSTAKTRRQLADVKPAQCTRTAPVQCIDTPAFIRLHCSAFRRCRLPHCHCTKECVCCSNSLHVSACSHTWHQLHHSSLMQDSGHPAHPHDCVPCLQHCAHPQDCAQHCAHVQAQLARLSCACYAPWQELRQKVQEEGFQVLAGGDTFFTRWFLARGSFHRPDAAAPAATVPSSAAAIAGSSNGKSAQRGAANRPERNNGGQDVTCLVVRGVMWRSAEVNSFRTWQQISRSRPVPLLQGWLGGMATGGAVQVHEGISEMAAELHDALQGHLGHIEGSQLAELTHNSCQHMHLSALARRV